MEKEDSEITKTKVLFDALIEDSKEEKKEEEKTVISEHEKVKILNTAYNVYDA